MQFLDKIHTVFTAALSQEKKLTSLVPVQKRRKAFGTKFMGFLFLFIGKMNASINLSSIRAVRWICVETDYR